MNFSMFFEKKTKKFGEKAFLDNPICDHIPNFRSNPLNSQILCQKTDFHRFTHFFPFLTYIYIYIYILKMMIYFLFGTTQCHMRHGNGQTCTVEYGKNR